jgi:hypothetical protein
VASSRVTLNDWREEHEALARRVDEGRANFERDLEELRDAVIHQKNSTPDSCNKLTLALEELKKEVENKIDISVIEKLT